MQLGLTGLCKPVQGNFLEMPFADSTFDGAYAIEATCHANKAHARAPLRPAPCMACRGAACAPCVLAA